MAVDADVVVVGSGAVGASIAYHAARAGHSVLVVEKEPGPALHQSGRNSGVVHVGYQYEPGSMKARFAIDGARRLKTYCRERSIPLVEDGLLVTATTEEEVARLDLARKRAADNAVEARLVERDGLASIEPHATGLAGLHVPAYASFDARGYVHALAGDAMREGVRFQFDTRVRSLDEVPGGVRVRTDKADLAAKVVVNAAGLYADRLAGPASQGLRVVPFRGYYAELRPDRTGLVRSHLYPAPDPELPFLGVHFSKRADGRVIVGPGAMLAFGREAYRFHQASARDLWSTFTWPGLYRLLARRKFRGLVRSEVAKSLSLRALWKEARELVPALERRDLVRSFAGNRAQVVTRDGTLLLEPVVRETGRCVHVLNAVSPGLTSSLAFGEDVARRATAKL